MNETSESNQNRRTPCWRNIILIAFVGLLVVSLFLPGFEQNNAQAVYVSLSIEDSAYTILIGLLATTLLLGLIWLIFQRRIPDSAA